MTPAPGRRPITGAVLPTVLVAVCLLGAACGRNDDPAAGGADVAPSPPPTSTPAPERQENHMRITLTIDGRELVGTLDDTPVARALLEQLPLTLPLEDFHSSERIAYLPDRLDTADVASAGGEVATGDIAYYGPWGNLALFYRAGATYTGGLVRLGRLDHGAAEHLAALGDDATVTITGS